MPARVCIIGAGPAGEAASRALSRARVPHDVFDENPRAGGNINRRQTDRLPTVLETRSFTRGIVRFRPLSNVLEVTPERRVRVSREGRVETRDYDAVFICAGAYDGHYPRPGMDARTCTTAGALQALLKGQGAVPEGRIVVAGGGPFVHVVAAELSRVGARVAHVVDRVPRRDYVALLRQGMALPRAAGTFVRAWSDLRRAGAHVHYGSELSGADGTTALIAAGRRVAFEHLAISDFFVPQVQLARTAGCAQTYVSRGHYYAVETDAFGRTSVAGVFVCGEGQGIRGAAHAEVSGLLAVCAHLEDRGLARPEGLDVGRLLRAQRRLVRFAERLEEVMYRKEPRRFADADEICACEGTSAGAARRALAFGLEDLSSIKIVTRCGMGPCQGRYCEPLLCRLIEAGGRTPREAFSQRGLVRPVVARELADG